MKLSVGPGQFPHDDPEWVDMDILPLPGIDVVQNAGKFPWPFPDETFDYIEAIDLIEHLEPYSDGKPTVLSFIEECYRLLTPKGTLFIQTPHWKSKNLWIDLTHVRGFDERSMDYFDPDTHIGGDYPYYSKCKFKVKSKVTDNLNVEFEMVKL